MQCLKGRSMRSNGPKQGAWAFEFWPAAMEVVCIIAAAMSNSPLGDNSDLEAPSLNRQPYRSLRLRPPDYCAGEWGSPWALWP